jgi:signal transduction histidine kinase
MSHELRTPMHAILSFACIGLLKADKAPPDRLQAYFQSIRGSCERLLAMVNDLLDLSKLEAGRMSYDMKRCDLRACCEEVRGEVAPLLEGKALRVAVVVRTEDCRVYGDPVRLAQVLRNLLGNAIKFSPAGGDIEVALEAATLPAAGLQGAARPALRLSVADRGAGIAADELESIFDDFTQGSRRQAGEGGTGLGLPICREIVFAHHGAIRAGNQPAGGAVFEVLLPREEPSQ